MKKLEISKDWTPEDRLLVIAAILPGLQDDIYAGRYSAGDRPNITTLQHVIADRAEVLEWYRDELEAIVRQYEAKMAEFSRLVDAEFEA